MTKISSPWLESVGRIFFGLTMVGLGVPHLVRLEFLTRMIPRLPAWVPGQPVWALAVGAVLSIAGLLILVGRAGARAGALAVVTVIALSLLLFAVPRLAAKPGVGAVWTNPCKFLALAGGAFLLAGLGSPRRAGEAAAPSRLRGRFWLARVLLGGFLTLCGIEHFVYREFVATLVPGWIPGHLFWTYFAGVALIAGGIGLLIPRTTRLAALLSGAMIFTWFLILHIPRALAGGGSVDEFSGVCESLAMSGVAFLIAGFPAAGEP